MGERVRTRCAVTGPDLGSGAQSKQAGLGRRVRGAGGRGRGLVFHHISVRVTAVQVVGRRSL